MNDVKIRKLDLLFFYRDLSDVASRAILIRMGKNDLTAVFSLIMIWFVKNQRLKVSETAVSAAISCQAVWLFVTS